MLAGSLPRCVGTLAAADASAPAGAAVPPGKYIDIHVHITQPWGGKPHLTRDRLLEWMDARRVARAVVLPLVSPEGWYYPVSTHWVFEQTAGHRDRLLPFCDIDPRCTYVSTPKAILTQLKLYIDAGARGLGEHKCGGPIDAPANLVIFRACSDLGLPILFHMDGVRNTDAPGLPGLERCLREAPGAVFIGHAAGFWSSISRVTTPAELNGYPKTTVKPGGALDRLMDKYDNLYGDLSAGSGLNAIRRDPDFGRAFLVRRADRLLFGTDYLAEEQKVEQFEFLDGLDLPPDVQAKIYRDNARRLLRLG